MFREEKVGDIKIYNVQQDCCYDQLEGATVTVLNDDMDEVTIVAAIPDSRSSKLNGRRI